MASTYSPALRLELMATGDQSGTWGDTTNTNLGTLLEQAITGYLSVAQGDTANLTLTTTNGASDQARNAVIRITGALTATRNVVIQTAAKLYTIANDTTGGFSIVVKTSGGTGVSVPPGAMVDVYSDGTNAVQGANYWSGSIGGAVYLDAGAAVGPNYDLFRDSTSPAANDILGRVTFNGRDSAGNKQEYGSMEAVITSPTSTTETGALDIYTTIAGTRTKTMSVGPNNPNTPTGFIDGYTTTATAAGTTVLTVLSTQQQFFTGATTQTVTLPVTSTLILGQTYRIFNASTGAVTVQSSGANSIVVIPANSSAILTCILTSGTSAASWSSAASAGVYTEGTWTPSVGGTATYITQAGRYTRNGRNVYAEGLLHINSLGTGSTGTISGLPFTSAATPIAAVLSVGFYDNLAASYTYLSGTVAGGTTDISMRGLPTAAAASMSVAIPFGNNARVFFSVNYTAA